MAELKKRRDEAKQRIKDNGWDEDGKSLESHF